MKNLVRGLAGLLSVGILSLLALTLTIQARLPDEFQVVEGEDFAIHSKLSIHASADSEVMQAAAFPETGQAYQMNLSLFRSIPLKAVRIQVVPRKMVVPGGSPFGIKMFTKGVMVVGMSDIQVGSETVNPAKEAGLKIGDILISINGQALNRNEDVANFISSGNGGEISISLNRGGTDMTTVLRPVRTEYDSKFRAGIWVRDSSAGIGTLTYYNPETMGFAGLGHAICDVDTGKLMPLSTGEIVGVNISGVNAGQSGKPGELRGSFTDTSAMGMLRINCESGIFGTLNYPCIEAEPVPMAYKQEIVPGPAVMLSTVSGSKPQQFDVVIEKINYLDENSTKNMVVRIVDAGLLARTGGIVQGMSGSPILQDGRLVGAVTHVFVNDPSRGYAIFSENMDKQLNFVEKEMNAA